jgi:hypothetical protein
MSKIEHKLSQFADDTTIILDDSASSLNENLDTLSTFTIISRLKVNFTKRKSSGLEKKYFVQVV